MEKTQNKNKKKILWMVSVGLTVFSGIAFSSINMGNMASSVTSSFAAITKLITGGSYLAGLGFSIAAIMKFKQHEDNPTQIPVGTPVALTFIAAAFLFLPSILSVAGATMFGDSGGSVSGSGGNEYTPS